MSNTAKKKQQEFHQNAFSNGGRVHVISEDPLVRYITRWRLIEGMKRLQEKAPLKITSDGSILALCAGEGLEASILADLGFTNVTTSDLSSAGVQAALARDSRLKGLSLDAEDTGLADSSYELVVVQDGLHHLPRPVQGFNEMLRIAEKAALFLEPHDAWVGRRLGTDWERNGDAVNYVFRWTKKLVDDVASSYLGPDAFMNLSFSFWHHNVVFYRIGRQFGGGQRGIRVIALIKSVLDSSASSAGNQFCGIITKR